MAKHKPYRYVIYLLVRLAESVVYLLPRAWVLGLARLLGRAGFYLIGRQRKKTLENLKLAFGQEKSDLEIGEIAIQSFEHLTSTALEMLRFPKLRWEELAQWVVGADEAFRVYREILRAGRGVISITAHMGNWELLAGIMAVSKTCQGAIIARRLYYERYDRWVVGLRQSLGVRTIYREDAARMALEILAKNQVVGLLPDQDIDSLKGVFVNYFGRPAYTPVAPVRLALASGAPILPNFLIRQRDGKYKIVLGEVLWPRVTTTRENAVREYTEKWMLDFEKVIRQYPQQWAWMHNRWKTQSFQQVDSPRDRKSVV